MILKIKKKYFSLRGRYEILDENDGIAYIIQGKFSMPKRFEIIDEQGNAVGEMRSKFFDIMPTFILYIDGEEIGRVKKQITFFKRTFDVDCKGWSVEGDILGWDYVIVDEKGNKIATLSKKILSLVDYYVMDIVNPEDALAVIMIALSIDVEKQE